MLPQVLRIKCRTSRRNFGEHIRNFSLISQYNDDHGPAYGFGVDARGRYSGHDFDDVEAEMSRDWIASRGVSILSWEWARHAARDGWNRYVSVRGVGIGSSAGI